MRQFRTMFLVVLVGSLAYQIFGLLHPVSTEIRIATGILGAASAFGLVVAHCSVKRENG